MIKLLILCEGNTDQILIGSYIEQTTNWIYVQNLSNNPFAEESINWYQNNTQIVGIWENGGNDFENSLKKICQREIQEHEIENLLIITDHDDSKAETEAFDKIKGYLRDGLKCSDSDNIKLNEWSEINFEDPFKKVSMNVGYMLVPLVEQGALETFMLNSLSESYDKSSEVVKQVDSFINNFKSEKYLTKRREKIKARLGVSLSIFNPDKSLKIMKEIISSVDWGKLDSCKKQFEMIRESLD